MIPTPYTVRVRRSVLGAPDEFGNPAQTWAEHDWRVRQIDPGASAEPFQPNRDLSNVVYSIHAPKTAAVPTVRDEVQVDGEWFQVDGEPDDYTRGPWLNPVAGVVVMLTRAEG